MLEKEVSLKFDKLKALLPAKAFSSLSAFLKTKTSLKCVFFIIRLRVIVSHFVLKIYILVIKNEINFMIILLIILNMFYL